MICKICNKDFCQINGQFCRHLGSEHKLSVLQYKIQYEDFKVPRCPICGKECRYKKKMIFYKTCGDKICEKTARENTCLERYGETCALKSTTIKERIKKRLVDLYGVDNPQKSEDIRKKTAETNIERYGARCIFLLDEYKETIGNTNKALYGAENVFASKDIQKRLKNTWLQNMGVDNPGKSEKVKEKIKQTWKKTLHVDHPLKDGNIRNRVRRSHLERALKLYEDRYADDFENMHIEDNAVYGTCKRCGHSENLSAAVQRFRLGVEICSECNPTKKHRSSEEMMLFDFISSVYNGDVLKSYRGVLGRRELDIYLPEVKIAFEFNGDFWHSSSYGKNKDYHMDKTNDCNAAGVVLVHVWEDEWRRDKELVKDKIERLLNVLPEIESDDCTVKEISKKEASIFEERNGDGTCVPADLCFGLFLNDEVVGMLAVSRTDSDGFFEVRNMLLKRGVSVKNGVEKLFQHFFAQNNPQEVSFVVSRDWPHEELKSIGFVETTHTDPNCFFIESGSYKRVCFSDVKSHKKSGWKIYDSGNSVYTWTRQQALETRAPENEVISTHATLKEPLTHNNKDN